MDVYIYDGCTGHNKKSSSNGKTLAKSRPDADELDFTEQSDLIGQRKKAGNVADDFFSNKADDVLPGDNDGTSHFYAANRNSAVKQLKRNILHLPLETCVPSQTLDENELERISKNILTEHKNLEFLTENHQNVVNIETNTTDDEKFTSLTQKLDDSNIVPNTNSAVSYLNSAEEFVRDNRSTEETVTPSRYKEASTVTDLCSSDNLPEVEILSLIEERIPQYHLRATGCYDYSNSDWVQTPVLETSSDLDLSPDQINETLKYFVLCGDRLTQMTKTYDDVQAITKLLEEKEGDLELAAKIGQILLEKNREITERNVQLEDQVSQSTDRVSQLRHDVSVRDELLKIYDEDLHACDSGSSSPSRLNVSDVNLHALQRKVQGLQDENMQLKIETARLHTDTKCLEEKEERLTNETVNQLSEVNDELSLLSDELIKKTDENMRQKDKITSLLASIVDSQKKDRSLTVENMELSKHLQSAQKYHRHLGSEVSQLQDRYDELLQLFESSQQDLRSFRVTPKVTQQHYLSTPNLGNVSLAAELNASLLAETDSGKADGRHNWKVFETAKAARSANQFSTNRLTNQSESSDCLSTPLSPSSCFSEDADTASNAYSTDCDSNFGYPIQGRVTPGSDISQLSHPSHYLPYLPSYPIHGRVTPGSDISHFSHPSLRPPRFSHPKRLQIIKPMEGSMILHHWQQLARPHLGRIFEVHPGINIKGERKLDVHEETVYSISDFEEDDDASVTTQSADDTSAVYTMTDSHSQPSSLHPSSPHLSSLHPSSHLSSLHLSPHLSKLDLGPPPTNTTFHFDLDHETQSAYQTMSSQPNQSTFNTSSTPRYQPVFNPYNLGNRSPSQFTQDEENDGCYADRTLRRSSDASHTSKSPPFVQTENHTKSLPQCVDDGKSQIFRTSQGQKFSSYASKTDNAQNYASATNSNKNPQPDFYATNYAKSMLEFDTDYDNRIQSKYKKSPTSKNSLESDLNVNFAPFSDLSESISPISDRGRPPSLLRRDNLAMFSTPKHKCPQQSFNNSQHTYNPRAPETYDFSSYQRQHPRDFSLYRTENSVSTSHGSSHKPKVLVSSLPGSNTSLNKIKTGSRTGSQAGLTSIFHESGETSAGVWSRCKARSPVKTETETEFNATILNSNNCHVSGNDQITSTHTNKGSENTVSSHRPTLTDSIQNIFASQLQNSAAVSALDSESRPASIWERLRSLSVYNIFSKVNAEGSMTSSTTPLLNTASITTSVGNLSTSSSFESSKKFSASVPELTETVDTDHSSRL